MVVKLTDRQLQMLRLMAEGHTIKSVALQAHIAPSTVKNHLQMTYEKLGAANITNAVYILCQRGELTE